jgi:hypothetical protein
MADANPGSFNLQGTRLISIVQEARYVLSGPFWGCGNPCPHTSSSLIHSCRYIDHASVSQLAALGHLGIFGDTVFKQHNTIGLQNMIRVMATLLVHRRFTNCNTSFL